MERLAFVEHRGKQILYHNFTNAHPADWFPVIEESQRVIGRMLKDSVLTLTDITNCEVDDAVLQKVNELLEHNKPYVRAAAIVGVAGFRKILLNTVMKLSGRKLEAFDTLDQAKNWLVRQ
jgi:hypothetical protein